MTRKSFIYSLFLLLFLAACRTDPPVTGVVVGKRSTPASTYFTTIYVDKTMYLIPVTDPPRYYLTLSVAMRNGDSELREFAVTPEDYTSITNFQKVTL